MLSRWIIGCCSVLGLWNASAVLGASFEDFESYTSGQVLNTGAGGTGDWSGAWASANSVTVQPFPASTSQGVQIQGNDNNIMSRGYTPSLTTTYVGITVRPSSFGPDDFISFQASDGATANAAGTLGFGIRNTGTSPFYARVGTSGNTDDSAVSAMNDTTYRLVAKFSMDAAASFNRTDLFLDPSGTDELSEIPIATQIGPLTGLTQLDFFTVRTAALEGGDTIFIDDLIISDSFAEATGIAIVPEPASLAVWALLGMFGVGFACRRFRR